MMKSAVTNIQEPEMLRVGEVLAIVRVSRRTLSRWIEKGSFPEAVPFSGRVLVWRASAVRDWLKQAEDAAGAEGATGAGDGEVCK